MYEEVIIEDGSLYIKKTDGDSISWIPADESNSMYQEYLFYKSQQDNGAF